MKTTEHASLRGLLWSLMLPIALATTWITTVVLRNVETSSLGAEIGIVIMAVPLTAWAFSRHQPSKEQAPLLALSVLPVLLMLAAAIHSTDPRTALLGAPPQWQGWLLWASVLGWFVLVTIGAEYSDTLSVAWVLAIAGTVTAVWTLLQVAGVLAGYVPDGRFAPALFDNPLSVGQALVVTVSCTVALALWSGPGSTRHRMPLVFGAVLQMAALMALGDRAALVAIGVGIAAYAVTERRQSRGGKVVRLLGGAGLAAFLVGFAILCAVWTGSLGPKAFATANHLVTSRLSIWTDVAEAASQHPLLGSGPEQFDNLVEWTALPDGRLDVWRTYDEHSILLSWVIGAGIFGLLAYGAAGLVLARRIVRLVMLSPASRSVRALAAGGAAVAVVMLFSWPDPLALLSISCVMGCLVSASYRREPARATRSGWAPAVVTATAAVLALVSLAPDVATQYRISNASSAEEYVSALSAGLKMTGDGFYLEEELAAANSYGGAAMADGDVIAMLRGLAADYPRDLRHRVDVPSLALDLLWTRHAQMTDEEYWRLTSFYALRGRQADPNLGLWRYALARAAVTIDRSDQRRHIASALQEQLPPGVEPVLEQWYTETSGSAGPQR